MTALDGDPKHVLLVNPWIHDFTAFDLWMKPLGLLYVAAALEQAAYQVSFVDCLDAEGGRAPNGLARYNCRRIRSEKIAKPGVFAGLPRQFKRYGISPAEFCSRLDAVPEPQLIGVTSMMTYWYPGVAETIALLKDRFPKVSVVLGGPYATLCQGHAEKATGADVVVAGRGERAMVELADQVFGIGEDRSGYSGDLDELPRPAYHHYGRPRSVGMLTSLGCPFRCTYCASHLLSPEFKIRRVDGVVDEIEHYARELGVEDAAFYDDALLVDSERHIEAICDGIVERAIRIRLHTPNGLHAERISPVLAAKLRAAGFKTIRLGFETSNIERQRASGVKVSNRGLRTAIHNLYGAGFSPGDVMVYVMVGMPGQPVDEVLESIRYVHESGARVSLSQFSPVPGTLDFTRAVESGFDGEEPLRANKTVYAMNSMDRSFEDYERLRRMSKEGNARVLSGVPSAAGRP